MSHDGARAWPPTVFPAAIHLCSMSGSANFGAAAPATPKPCCSSEWQMSQGFCPSISAFGFRTYQTSVAVAPSADGELILLKSRSTSKGTEAAPNVSFVSERPGAALTKMRGIATTTADTNIKTKISGRDYSAGDGRRQPKRARRDSARSALGNRLDRFM